MASTTAQKPESARHPAPHPIKGVLSMRRITMVEFAAEVRVNAATLGRICNGYLTPWPALRHRAAEALGLTEGELWNA